MSEESATTSILKLLGAAATTGISMCLSALSRILITFRSASLGVAEWNGCIRSISV